VPFKRRRSKAGPTLAGSSRRAVSASGLGGQAERVQTTHTLQEFCRTCAVFTLEVGVTPAGLSQAQGVLAGDFAAPLWGNAQPAS
jgi:hypothetical protein